MPIPVLPPSAPFSPAQRSWLNGFFAGIFGMDGGAATGNGAGFNGFSNNGAIPFAADEHSLNRVGSDSGGNDLIAAPPSSPAALNGVAPVGEEASGEDFPWHDPALSLDERMELAQNKPKPQQLMAAMAQLDCGQCGYLCQTYAQAIADGSEKSLKKCVPGEKPTANKLKELMAQ